MKSLNRIESKLWRRIGLATAIGIGSAVLASCSGNGRVDSETAFKVAKNNLEDTENKMVNLQDVNIQPGVLVTDGKVQVRQTPGKINTNNNAWITGNERISDEPVALLRPVIIENKTKINDQDPTYWAVAWDKSGSYTIGLNAETMGHISYYTKNSDIAQLCDDHMSGLSHTSVEFDPTFATSSNGITLDSGNNIYVPAAQPFIGKEAVDTYRDQLTNKLGYHVTSLCIGQIGQ